jgi:hypothetical protein
MVLPEEIGDAAQDADDADVARVKAWLASGGDIALRLLLRAGASLDHKARHEAAADGWETVTAEDIIINTYGYNNQDDETVTAMHALIAGVRKHGTYKRYMRAPHREFLALRGLAQRGKLSTEHRALNFIAKLGERGVVWHILTYWRPTE